MKMKMYLKADNYSGYGFDYDPYPGDMYINGYLCDVKNTGDGSG